MFDNPTIIPLTIVLIIFMGITLFQRSFLVTTFLFVTYCMYIGFIYFSESEKEVVIQAPVNNPISSKITIIDSSKSQSVDTIKNADQMPSKLDTVHQIKSKENKIVETSTSNLELNYMQIARNVDSKERAAIDPGTVFPDTIRNLYCMSGIDNRNGGSQELVHLWRYKGVTVTKVTMQIERSINWRCWSVVNIDTRKKGTWVVSVADTNGNEFGSTRFYIKHTE